MPNGDVGQTLASGAKTVGSTLLTILQAASGHPEQRRKEQETLFRARMADKDPRLLSLPEMAKAYDKVMGAPGAHNLKLLDFHQQQRERQNARQIMEAYGVPQAPTVSPSGIAGIPGIPPEQRRQMAPGPVATEGSGLPPATLQISTGTQKGAPRLGVRLGEQARSGGAQDVGHLIDLARQARASGDIEKSKAYEAVVHNKEMSFDERVALMTSAVLGRAVSRDEVKPIPTKTLSTWEWQQPGQEAWSAVPPMPNFSSADMQSLQEQGWKFREKGSQVPVIGPLLKPAGAPFPARTGGPEVKTAPAPPAATPKAAEASALPHGFSLVDEP